MTKQTLILITLFSIVIAGILITAFFGMVTVKATPPKQPQSFEYTEPKDLHETKIKIK
jgi:hypothetical protein